MYYRHNSLKRALFDVELVLDSQQPEANPVKKIVLEEDTQ